MATETPPLRVHLLYEHNADQQPHGCSVIRWLRPLRHPSIAAALEVTAGVALPATPVDILIIERLWAPHFTLAKARQLMQAARQIAGRCLYTLDDNLLDLHLDQNWQSYPSDEERNIIRYLAREADALIVSTPALAARMAGFNAQIHVLPNALDEGLFADAAAAPPDADKPQKRRLGYMGTPTHFADLMLVYEPLRAFLHDDAQTELQILGISQNPEQIQALFADLPVCVLDTQGAVSYEAFVAWCVDHLRWDFAIAPLEDNPFTRCKSDIKFLDYALLGIPGIYSQVGPYAHSIRHESTGLLVHNQPDAWQTALHRLATDAALRAHIRTQAHAEVRAQRTLQTQASQWLNTLKAL